MTSYKLFMTNEIFTIQPEKSVKFNSQIDFRMSIKMSTFHFFTESFLAAKSTFNTNYWPL